uniref:Uncharacterized protein n=1 Tax=Rhipicephalus microplus TaxID=6941 RepID=A0A6M2D945_RHIMP
MLGLGALVFRLLCCYLFLFLFILCRTRCFDVVDFPVVIVGGVVAYSSFSFFFDAWLLEIPNARLRSRSRQSRLHGRTTLKARVLALCLQTVKNPRYSELSRVIHYCLPHHRTGVLERKTKEIIIHFNFESCQSQRMRGC